MASFEEVLVKLVNLDTSSVARKPGVSNHPLLFWTTVTLRNTEGLSPHFATNRSGVHGRCHERVLKINELLRPSKSRLRLDVIYYLSHVTITIICIHRFISRAFVAFILPPESTRRVLRSPILYPNQTKTRTRTGRDRNNILSHKCPMFGVRWKPRTASSRDYPPVGRRWRIQSSRLGTRPTRATSNKTKASKTKANRKSNPRIRPSNAPSAWSVAGAR